MTGGDTIGPEALTTRSYAEEGRPLGLELKFETRELND